MGEIAEMMLDGTLCEGCGEYIGKAQGFPGYCSEDCARDRGALVCEPVDTPVKRFRCVDCNKGFKTPFALHDHLRDKHSVLKP